MSNNAIWQRQDWRRFIRHDAHRFAPPSVQTKSFAARRIEQRQAEGEETARAAELRAFYAEHLALRRELAEVKFELAWRRLCRKYGYNPNQPRVPGGNSDGGQWTSGGGLGSGGKVRLAAMSWDERRRALFGQGDLFRGEGGGGNAPALPSFKGGPTSGVLRIPGRADEQLISGYGGPAASMPKGAAGFDIVTVGHVEGHAAAIMQSEKIMEGTLFINNPTICSSCLENLPRMLPAGAKLDIIDGLGRFQIFIGVKP